MKKSGTQPSPKGNNKEHSSNDPYSPPYSIAGEGSNSKNMRLKVALSSETSEHAGAGGMFQIDMVIDSGTSKNLTHQVDIGRHFSNFDELDNYLKEVFGPETKFDLME